MKDKITKQDLVRCSRCGQHKEAGEFGKNSRRENGLDFYCKVCRNEMYKGSYISKGRAVQKGKLHKRGLVAGVGINDVDYAVYVEGEFTCPYYRAWTSMLNRVYRGSVKRRPSYKDVKICPEWVYFSNFKFWMESQQWQGLELDKDLLSGEDKIYSPETCVFVPEYVNQFLSSLGKDKKGVMGIYKRPSGKYSVSVGHQGAQNYLGTFGSLEEAKEVSKIAKISNLSEIVNRYKDEPFYNKRVEIGLINLIAELESPIEN